MRLNKKDFNSILARNPALSVSIASPSLPQAEISVRKPDKEMPKYRNKPVYVFQDGYVSGNKSEASQHGKIKEKYDSTKEYQRWIDLCFLQTNGKISNLTRQKVLTIEESFQYQGETIHKIVYRADFCSAMDAWRIRIL